MNKEQIEKHGDVIIWFATDDNADKGMWCYDMHGWHIEKEPSFSENLTYIQNDEYAEFRKAQADGKVIDCFVPDDDRQQYFYQGIPGRIYYNVKDFLIKGQYLIKPDEPKFKVGSWIVVNNEVVTQYEKSMILVNESNSELWQPTEGEWCVFKERGEKNYIIDKYVRTEIYPKKGVSTKCDKHWTEYVGVWFHEVYPLEYLQTLEK